MLPETHQTQHRLRDTVCEHLKCNQHPNREIDVPHHEPRAEAKDGRAHQLLEPVCYGVVRVGELAGPEIGLQVGCEIFLVALPELGFHLQRLDRFHPRDVLGQKRLVAGAEQELLIQPLLEKRRDKQTDRNDRGQNGERHEREPRAVDDHQREKDHEEGAVEKQRHRGTRQKLANRFHPVQPGRDDARSAMLEIANRKLEQMRKHGHPEHRVHPIAGMAHEILPYPR